MQIKDIIMGLGIGAGIYLITEYIDQANAEAAILTTRPLPPPTGPGIIHTVAKTVGNVVNNIVKGAASIGISPQGTIKRAKDYTTVHTFLDPHGHAHKPTPQELVDELGKGVAGE